MSENSKSVNEEQLKPIQDAMVAPDTANIAKLLEQQDHVVGAVTVSDIERPEMGGSSGSLGLKARINEGDGYQTKDLFIRFKSMGDNAFKKYDLPTQFRTLQILANTNVPVPRMLCQDADGSTLGTPGFIMEKLEGRVPSDFYQSGLFAEVSAEDRRTMIFEVARAQANIHNLDWQALGLDFLKTNGGDGNTYIERELNRCWENICWGCPERIPEAEPLYRWLIENQPQDPEVVLCHGDANYTNYMFRDNELVAVLDWEFAFLGPREFDPTFLLAVTDVLTIGQTPPEGFPTHPEILAEYEKASGNPLQHLEYAYKRAYFTIATHLWMGIRFFPPKTQKELEVRPNYCVENFDKVAQILR